MKQSKKTKNRLKRILLYVISFVLTYILLATTIAPEKYDLSVGDIANSDIKAPRDIVDETATKEKMDEASNQVSDQYELKSEVKTDIEDTLTGFIDKSMTAKSITDTSKRLEKIKEYTDVSLSDDQYEAIMSLDKEELNSLKSQLVSVIEEVYKTYITEGDNDALENAKKTAIAQVDKLSYDSNAIKSLENLVTSQIKANMVYDEEKTNELKKEAKENIEKVVIKKNQIIVSEGEPITEKQLELLSNLGLLNEESGKDTIIIYILLAVYICVIQYLEYYYLYKNSKNNYNNLNRMVLINLLLFISLILTKTIGFISVYAIPFVMAPLLMSLLIDYKVALYTNTLNIAFIATLVEFDPQIIILALVATVIGSIVLKKMQQRNDIIFAGVYISVICSLLNFSIGVVTSSDTKTVLLNSLLVIVGSMLSSILAIGFLPFFEACFDIVTTLKLLELSNPNSPLLKKLLMEAPGTYHHSMLVANLAEMAADEVGANSVITRIGAYYHDIGKTIRPYFFKENQLGKDNPHDKINPTLSTLIITSHVKDGVQLAKENNLPEVIQDIIAQHHGTTLVKYFYYTVKNNSDNPDEVNKDDFRYPGPIPTSKEAGIIMLADSIEAAVRSINEPSKEKIEKMVYDITEDKLSSGQLDDCDLTLKDLSKIRKCFLKALIGIYHQRIEYPTDKVAENKDK